MHFASTMNRKIFPCYIIAPQCPPGCKWVDVDWKLPSHVIPKQPSVYLARTMLLVDSLVKNLNIDPDRIYITGISMGGFGVWDAISHWPDKFAAAVPVCGGGDTAKAAVVKDIPIWDFHGDQDNVVMTSRSRDMIAAIKKAGGNPKYTEYTGTGHNAWDKAYSEKELYSLAFLPNQCKGQRMKKGIPLLDGLNHSLKKNVSGIISPLARFACVLVVSLILFSFYSYRAQPFKILKVEIKQSGIKEFIAPADFPVGNAPSAATGPPSNRQRWIPLRRVFFLSVILCWKHCATG